MQKIILASQSPRRKELLSKMGVRFEVIPSHFDEHLDDSRPPEEVAVELAIGKALTVAKMHPDAIVIGSDTIVTVDGKQLEKPHDLDEARSMIKMLSGKDNTVTSGLAVLRLSDGIRLVGADSSTVYFRPYDEEKTEAYVSTGDPLDKAGGYGLQSGAATLVDYMVGEYDTVLGMPTKLLALFLTRFGITAKPADVTLDVKRRNASQS